MRLVTYDPLPSQIKEKLRDIKTFGAELINAIEKTLALDSMEDAVLLPNGRYQIIFCPEIAQHIESELLSPMPHLRH